jgi:hypothetical protein
LQPDDSELGEILDQSHPVYEPYHDMSQLPRTRFGFTEFVTTASYDKKPLDDILCLKSLGDEKWPGLAEPRYRHLASFFAYLDSVRHISEIPMELLDLRQEGAEVSHQSHWAITVSRQCLNGKVFYLLRPKAFSSEKFPLHILLPSAATTLQVIRMGWGPDPQEIIYHLLQHGVEFRVCIRDSVRIEPQLPLPDRYTGLGYRRTGYKPTVVDYGVYGMLRERFLQSPRGRAALFAGGIVGRLAREAVDDVLASLGPSYEVFSEGVRLWDGTSPTAYWDDALTDQEIDLICGVYEVATGVSTCFPSASF